jgi:hypothetical protein
MGVWYLIKTVRAKLKVDLTEKAPIKMENGDSEVPALFGHATDDELIPFKEAQQLFEHYPNPNKRLIELPGQHNTQRGYVWIRSGVDFCLEALGRERLTGRISIAPVIFDHETLERIA